MDDDKNPAPTTTDAGQADQSAAQATTTDIDISALGSQKDPRLMVVPEGEQQDPEPPTDEPPAPADPVVAPPEPPAEPPVQDEPPAPVADPPADTPPTSRRENRRIAELTRKLQEANLRQQPQDLPQNNGQIIGDGEYDTDQINGMARQYGDNRYLEGVRQASDSTLFATRLEIDAPKVEAEYPQLNPRSDKFDPGLADYTTQMFYNMVGMKVNRDGTFSVKNPDIRYTDVVGGLVEAVESLASSRQADSTANLARQAAQTGVRPAGTAKPNVYQGNDPKQMSIEQLRAMANKEAGL